MQHGAQRSAGGGGQGQRGQRVGSVVPATDAQGIHRHHALEIHLVFGVCGPPAFAGFVQRQRTHQPFHAVHRLNAPVARAGGCAQAKRGVRPGRLLAVAPAHLHRDQRRLHGHDLRVVAVEQHERLGAKDGRLGLRVGSQRTVPVQVVFGDVEHGGCRGHAVPGATGHAVQLEAGQLQHPHGGQVGRLRQLQWWRHQLDRAFVFCGFFCFSVGGGCFCRCGRALVWIGRQPGFGQGRAGGGLRFRCGL